MAVLIGYDDTPYGQDALVLGLGIAERRHEPATVASVFPDDERGLMVAINDSQWLHSVRTTAEYKLDSARQLVGDQSDVEVAYETLGPASASRALHEYAERTHPAVLVVGSSERAAIGRVSLGSTVERLLPGAPCPVAVAPRGYSREQRSIRRIAVAYDESPEAEQALELAAMIAQRDALSLRIVIVSPRGDTDRQRRIEERAARLPLGVKATTDLLLAKDVVATLADLPGEQPDLLLCGSRGYGAVRQVLLGSVSSRLIRHAGYPVVVVPHAS